MTALDIIVFVGIGAAAALGAWRGFVSEVLSLLVWVVLVVALKLLHTPLAAALAGPVGTSGGAAVLSFAIIAGVAYFGGRIVANTVGAKARTSVFGSLDRVLGLGFGALKGLILASVAFLLLALVVDLVSGGPAHRPRWITDSTTYPILDKTSRYVADFVDRRRKGVPVFGGDESAANESDGVTTEVQ